MARRFLKKKAKPAKAPAKTGVGSHIKAHWPKHPRAMKKLK